MTPELAYLEALPLLALLSQLDAGSNERHRLPEKTSFAIRECLVNYGLITPPSDGWAFAYLTPKGVTIAKAIAAARPEPPEGLTPEQCRALGHLRRQELADRDRRGRTLPRERSREVPEEGWLDLQKRGLVILARPSGPLGRRSGSTCRAGAGSAALTQRGRNLADDLLGGAGGRVPKDDEPGEVCTAPRRGATCEGPAW